MLDAIGAGQQARIGDKDWGEIWNESEELDETKEVILRIKEDRMREVAGQPAVEQKEYATPLWHQIKVVTKRQLKAFYRSPNYGFTRLINHVIIALLTGLMFLNLDDSRTSLQYRIFIMFQVTVLPALILAQVEPKYGESHHREHQEMLTDGTQTSLGSSSTARARPRRTNSSRSRSPWSSQKCRTAFYVPWVSSCRSTTCKFPEPSVDAATTDRCLQTRPQPSLLASRPELLLRVDHRALLRHSRSSNLRMDAKHLHRCPSQSVHHRHLRLVLRCRSTEATNTRFLAVLAVRTRSVSFLHASSASTTLLTYITASPASSPASWLPNSTISPSSVPQRNSTSSHRHQDRRAASTCRNSSHLVGLVTLSTTRPLTVPTARSRSVTSSTTSLGSAGTRDGEILGS